MDFAAGSSKFLTKDADYQVLKVTATQIQLKRLANKKWRQDPGPLLLMKLKCPDGPEQVFGNGHERRRVGAAVPGPGRTGELLWNRGVWPGAQRAGGGRRRRRFQEKEEVEARAAEGVTLLTDLQGKGAPRKDPGARVQGRGVAAPDGRPPRRRTCKLRGRPRARRAAPPPRARRRDGVQGQGRAVPRRSAGTLGHRVGARSSPPPSPPRTYIAPDGAPLRLSKNLLSGLPRAHGEAIAPLKVTITSTILLAPLGEMLERHASVGEGHVFSVVFCGENEARIYLTSFGVPVKGKLRVHV